MACRWARHAPEIRLGHTGHGLQERNGHVLADDGGHLEEELLRVRQAVEARLQDALDGSGTMTSDLQVGVLGHRARELLQEERHAFGMGHDHLGQLGRQLLLGHDGMDHGEAVRRRQPIEPDLAGIGPSQPRRPVARAVRGDQHERITGEALGERGQRFLGGLVDPLDVLDGEDERTPAAPRDPHLAQHVHRARLDPRSGLRPTTASTPSLLPSR